METYAEVNGINLLQYPFGLAQLQVENPYTNYVVNVDLATIYPQTDHAKATGNTLAPVTIAPQPAYNAQTQIVVPNPVPTLIAGVWTLGWTVSAMSAEQLVAEETVLLQQTLAAGVVVTSTSTPALNGTYGCAPQDQANLTAITTGLADNEGLPGGGSTFAYLDMTATPHVFTAAQITALAVAMRNYVYAATIAFMSGQTPPSNALTLA